MHDRDLDGPPVPFTMSKTRTLRCGCRQQRWNDGVGGPFSWHTYHFCRRHDLLDDLSYLWRWARRNEWLKLIACGLWSAALTYLVFGGS